MQSPIFTSVDRAAERLCRRMASLQPLHDAILADLRMLARDRPEVAAGRMFMSDGDRAPGLYVMESGWALRTRTLRCGRRQIIDYCLPGDMLGAETVMFGAAGFDLVARSAVRLVRLEAPGPADLWRRYPGLAAAVTWTTAQEQSVMAERIVSLGRRDSLEKLAFTLCEMASRLDAIGLLSGDLIETPVNQEDFADILGISVIHVNRTFRRLSEERVVDYAKSRIRILDRRRLADFAGFAPGYLHFARDEAESPSAETG